MWSRIGSGRDKGEELPPFHYHFSRQKEEEVIEEDAGDESCYGVEGIVCLNIYCGEEHQREERDDKVKQSSAAAMPC